LSRAQSTGEQTPLLAPSALDAPGQYHFPDNVRELENILERALTLALAETYSIGASDLRLPQHGGVRPGSNVGVEEAVFDLSPGNGTLPSYSEQRSAPRSRRRWKKTSGTRRARRRSWGLRSGRCGTSLRSWAWIEGAAHRCRHEI